MSETDKVTIMLAGHYKVARHLDAIEELIKENEKIMPELNDLMEEMRYRVKFRLKQEMEVQDILNKLNILRSFPGGYSKNPYKEYKEDYVDPLDRDIKELEDKLRAIADIRWEKTDE